jgi:ABC-type bacteriocin/lantibiotic exporter with double-glycine peptidase domain
VEFFSQRYAGEISSRVAINDQVAMLLSGQLATTALNIVTIVFFIFLMLRYDVLLTVIGVGIAVLNIVLLQYVSRQRADANLRLGQEKGKMVGTAFNGLQIIETLKASGSESEFFARWAGFYAKTVNAEQHLGLSSQLLQVIPPMLSAINTTAILGVGSALVIQGKMTIGTLVAFQSLMASFLAPVGQMVNLGGNLQEADGNMQRLDDVLHYDIDHQTENVVSDKEWESTARLKGQVELRDVTFGYSPLAPALIENLSLTLKPGARVALVGIDRCQAGGRVIRAVVWRNPVRRQAARCDPAQHQDQFAGDG